MYNLSTLFNCQTAYYYFLQYTHTHTRVYASQEYNIIILHCVLENRFYSNLNKKKKNKNGHQLAHSYR